MLNRLRHEVSYSQFEEIDCLQKLARVEYKCALPANIKSYVRPTLALENID